MRRQFACALVAKTLLQLVGKSCGEGKGRDVVLGVLLLAFRPGLTTGLAGAIGGASEEPGIGKEGKVLLHGIAHSQRCIQN